MTSFSVARHRTAIRRLELSRPIRLALNDQLITKNTLVFDYGCGQGDDMRNLQEQGIHCFGWDPAYYPKLDRKQADVVNLGYVINVIENPSERADVLRDAWILTRKILVVSARLTMDIKNQDNSTWADGCLTSRGTFQKFYEQHELRDWIDTILGVSSVAASPGTVYVFRDEELRQSFLASRYRRRALAPRLRRSDMLFESHKALLEPLMDFLSLRGRIPEEEEVPEALPICNQLGSLRKAFGIIRRVTGAEHWDRIREERSQDLLVYLALSRFHQKSRIRKTGQGDKW